MERVIHPFTSEEDWLSRRIKNLNSTEISTLFGVNPYMGMLELWDSKKKGTQVNIEETERMALGKRLERPIMEHIAETKGWNVQPYKNYIEIPSLRLASSFDGIVLDTDSLLEIKNIDYYIYKKTWVDGESTPTIELQVQNQMLVSGKKHAYIAALVGGNTIDIIERDADPEIHAAILGKVAQFWQSIDAGVRPQPDYIKDSEYIKSLYNTTDGSEIASEEYYELCKKYKAYSQMESEAKEMKDAVKAEILMGIGSASKVKGSRYSISANMVKKAEYVVKAQEYRNLRITVKE